MSEEIPNKDTSDMKRQLASLYLYLSKQWGIKTIPKVKLLYDQQNADNILGNTGHYDPQLDTIGLYVIGRHVKDVLRTFSHECRHKVQYENNMFNINNEHDTSPGYAQKNENLRMAEADAFLYGNLMFRDWCDTNI